jgi:hypothetical protein
MTLIHGCLRSTFQAQYQLMTEKDLLLVPHHSLQDPKSQWEALQQ